MSTLLPHMDVVSGFKRIRAALADRAIPQRVVFHHVPKCGGTSIGRALRRRYILSQATVHPEASYRAFEAFSGRSDREQMLIDVGDLREQMLLYLLFQDVRCVSAHVRFSRVAHELFGERYKFVTLLRHPLERFMSNYDWSYNRQGAHASIFEEFPAFLHTARAARMGAGYVEFFSGLPGNQDLRSDRSIAAALENLSKLDVVGSLDKLDRFRDALGTSLGLRIRVGHHNKSETAAAIGLSRLSPATRTRLAELCAPDLTIWEELFPSRVKTA